jgi:hypothetical protein
MWPTRTLVSLTLVAFLSIAVVTLAFVHLVPSLAAQQAQGGSATGSAEPARECRDAAQQPEDRPHVWSSVHEGSEDLWWPDTLRSGLANRSQ